MSVYSASSTREEERKKGRKEERKKGRKEERKKRGESGEMGGR